MTDVFSDLNRVRLPETPAEAAQTERDTAKYEAQYRELKGREELIGEIIGLLQSPMKNVISALQGSGGHKIAGLVKALEERAA